MKNFGPVLSLVGQFEYTPWCQSVLQCFDAVGWAAGRASGL